MRSSIGDILPIQTHSVGMMLSSCFTGGNIMLCSCFAGGNIDAEDSLGDNALTIAGKFGHKACERHLFLFRWQERAKQIRTQVSSQYTGYSFFLVAESYKYSC